MKKKRFQDSLKDHYRGDRQAVKNNGPVRDKNGTIATEEREMEEVWANHCESFLNRP